MLGPVYGERRGHTKFMDSTRSLLGMVVLLTVFGIASAFPHLLPETSHFQDAAVHAILEIFGSVSALFFASILFIQCHQDVRARHFYPVALGFMSMGMLDGFHAIANDALPGFVWLHSLAAFFGGFFPALVWTRWNLQSPALLRIVIIVSAALGGIFLLD